MPSYVPKWMQWQLQVLPQVIWNFKRPIYLAPQNNQPGGPQRIPKPIAKPAPMVHIPKQTRSQALAVASIGTAVGGPTTASYLKITDLPPGSPQSQPLQASGPSLGSAPTANVRPFQKDSDHT